MHALRRPIPHDAIRLERWHRRSLYGLLLLLFLSGIALLLLRGTLGISLERWLGIVDEPDSPAHQAAAWSVIVHGGLVMPALLLTGALINSHIRKAWRLGRNRWSGGMIVLLMLTLTVSAELLYYAGAEHVRNVASSAHWIAGLILFVALPVHIVAGRVLRKTRL